MKFRWFPLSLISATALGFVPTLTPSASAQCVMADVSVQAAIRGERPAEQSNQVEMQSSGSCVGNTTTQTNTQVYTGSDRVVQQRKSRQYIQGGKGNPTGVNGPIIRVPVGVQVDVYNPAYNPKVLNPSRR